MTVSKSKNYDGHIYVKDDLQRILNTTELKYVNSAISVLFFADNVSLERAKDSLKVIEAVIDDLIEKEKHESSS